MARDINFTSAKKMKADQNSKISNLQPVVPNSDAPVAYSTIHGSAAKTIAVPTEEEMNDVYAQLGKCSTANPLPLAWFLNLRNVMFSKVVQSPQLMISSIKNILI